MDFKAIETRKIAMLDKDLLDKLEELQRIDALEALENLGIN